MLHPPDVLAEASSLYVHSYLACGVREKDLPLPLYCRAIGVLDNHVCHTDVLRSPCPRQLAAIQIRTIALAGRGLLLASAQTETQQQRNCCHQAPGRTRCWVSASIGLCRTIASSIASQVNTGAVRRDPLQSRATSPCPSILTLPVRHGNLPAH